MNAAEPSTTDRTVTLVLEPLDVLFFRDGRPFGHSGQAESLPMPLPQTLAGAVCTALLEQHGCPFTELAAAIRQQPCFAAALEHLGLPPWLAQLEIRGPFLGREPGDSRKPDDIELLYPMPANLVRDDDHAPPETLFPLPPSRVLPGWNTTRSSKLGLRPLWRSKREKNQRVPGFLSTRGMSDYLAGRPVQSRHVVSAAELYRFDTRTGIGIDRSSQTAQDQLIYSATFLSLNNDPRRDDRVVFVAEVSFPEECERAVWPASVSSIPWGGEGRRVAVEPIDHRLDRLHPTTDTDEDASEFYVLTTPAVFDNRWCPARLQNRVVAAALPGSVAVSGWDLAAGGPKPSRHAAVAGSVYFIRGSLDSHPSSLADRALDRQQGWGCYLRGVWHDEHGNN